MSDAIASAIALTLVVLWGGAAFVTLITLAAYAFHAIIGAAGKAAWDAEDRAKGIHWDPEEGQSRR